MKNTIIIFLSFLFFFSCTGLKKDIVVDPFEERNIADSLNDFLFQAINNGDNLVYMYDNYSNFEINYDEISVLEPKNSSYLFDTIKYISTYLFIYFKDGQYNIVSHGGKHLPLPNSKARYVGDKEWTLYNQDFELYYSWINDTLTYFEIYKFSNSRDQIISDLKTRHGDGEYIGRGTLLKKTTKKVWKEHLSLERNIQLYGNNAYSTTYHRYSHASVKKLFETNARVVGKEYLNILPERNQSGVYWKENLEEVMIPDELGYEIEDSIN